MTRRNCGRWLRVAAFSAVAVWSGIASAEPTQAAVALAEGPASVVKPDASGVPPTVVRRKKTRQVAPGSTPAGVVPPAGQPMAVPGLPSTAPPALTTPGLTTPGLSAPGLPGDPGGLLPTTPLPPLSPPLSTAPVKLPDTTPKRTLADCMKLWERATHMTRTEWRATCQRGIREADRAEKAARRATSKAKPKKRKRRRD